MNQIVDAIAANPVESFLAIAFMLTVLINLWTAARAGEWSRFRELLLALGPDFVRALKTFRTTPAAASAKSRASFQIDALEEAGFMPHNIIIESVDKAGNTTQSVAPPADAATKKTSWVPPLPVFLALAVGLGSLLGCGSALEDTVKMVRVSSEIVALAEPCLLAAYERELSRCLEEHADVEQARACGDAVDARWEASKEAFDVLRAARCSLEPEKCGGEQ